MGLGYWQVVQSQSLSDDPRNPLVVQASRAAPRGQIITANGEVLAKNSGTGASAIRVYQYPDFAPVLGYKSLIFGTAGLERAYDQQLIGLRSLSPGDEFFAKFRGDHLTRRLVVSLDVAKLQRAAVDALGQIVER
jgi:cell division protein FtsI/penicillin-binding protein 2